MFRDRLFNANTSIFRAHLIWLSGPQCDPKVRMLLSDKGSVYEGIASWSRCRTWLGSFLGASAPDQTLDNLKKSLERNKYAALSNLTIRHDDLNIYGLQRVDQ